MSNTTTQIEGRFLYPDNWETGTMINGRGKAVHTARALPDRVKGHVLLAQGLGEFAPKFTELARDFNRHGLGFHVFDRQGQGLSGRNADHRFKIHCDDYRDDVKDITQYAMQKIPKDGTSIILLGHSTGGLLSIPALHADNQRPIQQRLFSGAVLTDPLLGFREKMAKGREPLIALLPLLSARVRQAFVPGGLHFWTRRDDPLSLHKPEEFSTDPVRAAVHDYWQTHHPLLQVSSATIGWVQQMARAMMAIRRPGYIESIEHPITVCVGDMQLHVDAASIVEAVHRMPQGNMYPYPHGKHELLMERDAIRTPIIAEVVRMALKP